MNGGHGFDETLLGHVRLSFVVASSVVAMYAIDLIAEPVSMRVACDVFHAEWALVCSE